MANVLEQYAVTAQAYNLLAVPNRLTHDTFDGGHVWRGTAALAWLDRVPSRSQVTAQPLNFFTA